MSIDFTMTLRKFFTFLHKSPWKSMFFPQILVNSSVIPTTFTLPSWNLPLISLTRGLSSLYLIRHKKDVKEQKWRGNNFEVKKIYIFPSFSDENQVPHTVLKKIAPLNYQARFNQNQFYELLANLSTNLKHHVVDKFLCFFSIKSYIRATL